ncbi:Hypothetical predicted protein, partial [Paramuricea clavata]
GNPFEEESLPKAYYFPSLERHLSSSQKKTCFSPNKESDHQRQTSKADAKFLRESNKLEIPTREDGTVQHDLSSGSQFNESWPSTDKNVSSLSQNTPSSSSTPAEIEKENHSVKTASKDLHEDRLSRPTLSKYIDRFRHGVPTSREDRSLASSGKDFWWLSPPSNTSTPKETSDSTTSKFTSDGSSKIRRNATSTSPPRQKYGFKRNQFSRPVREAVAARDSSTSDLLARTNELLEKSENTLSEVSSESIPKPPSSWMIEKQKRLDDAAKNPVTKPRRAPEDDILYQWRLARRLEKAQEETKGSQGKRFGNTASYRTAALTRGRYNAYLPEQDHPRYHMDSGNRRDDFEPSGNTSFRHVSKMSGRTVHEDKIMYHATDDQSWRDKGDVSGMPERENVKCRERKKLAVALESNVPAVCFIDEQKLPSHVHMMCDIVPCSKQIHAESRDVGRTNHSPSASDLHHIERGQKARTEFDSADIQYQDGFRERSSIRVGDVAEGPRIHGLTNTSCNPGLTDTEKERKEYDTTNNKNSYGKQKIIPNRKQPLMTNLETAESDSVRQTASALESDKNDRSKLHYGEHVKVDTDNSVSRETVEDLDTDKFTKTAEENESKPKPSLRKGNDQTNLVNTSAPLVSRHAHQRTDRDGSGDQLTNTQNEGVIGTVIGQVISERLFSSMCDSRRSSLSSSSVYTECEDVKDKNNMVSTSKECESYVEQEPKKKTTDAILFPDDDILIRLRQQADFYREHLRNIDGILEQLTE